MTEAMPDNMLKYENYKEQNKRLTKALQNEFYLEAVFIEYAIMEDRTESILRYEGNTINSNGFVSIDRKITKIEKIAENKKGLARKNFTIEFMEQIRTWKNKRNGLIHALIKKNTTTQELIDLAEEGRQITKELCRLSTNYKRAVIRQAK
ncbi:hypothetical protein [Anaerolactibacter massiliensis]|uniref:hypothetical protein n=1 Tax=Anaerolactibacter massiliensis TaxID=2044573 RepID=UPI000CFA0751|nr:hypothetical protein [Anaerolactibacter massiliensis]